MAHLAVGFFALCLLAPVAAWPPSAPLLLVPVAASIWIIRVRTVADPDGVTARTLLTSRRVGWDDVDGLRFTKGSWARAHLTDGAELTLPAVTFATLPRLAEASAGRVPNPYR
ncbi:PH domain-containing protein [Mycolicibacillus parakoreensis]|uniref:PH domain-containing protein n=1 Tax=Mycolicibacillus parakoreensis TaxID=1069221 RepID=A0ABY3UB42_9MYCO|nr:PH domain-containing protein [Mycolicibacillus parakoreensis]MCV7315808.1 PH domain-containing protein [Mycolicibacillus parakoreensis]ULN54655.1 PH domain-containing protein [Mycolicibacillus parakoreensis]HLR99440.1 PH domain-containing protein [Mycolicibacillus parakoreensis]